MPASEVDANANELSFLNAMSAYRKAKESGDPEAIAKAEEAWRQQVRAELTGEDCAK